MCLLHLNPHAAALFLIGLDTVVIVAGGIRRREFSWADVGSLWCCAGHGWICAWHLC